MESLRRQRAHVSSCCCVMPSGGALLNTSTNSTLPAFKLPLYHHHSNMPWGNLQTLSKHQQQLCP